MRHEFMSFYSFVNLLIVFREGCMERFPVVALQGLPWLKYRLVSYHSHKLRVPFGQACRPCTTACSIAYPEIGWDEICRKVHHSQGFRATFFQVRNQCFEGDKMTINVKSYREQEVEMIQIFGKRIEVSSRFLSLEEFEEEFGAKASDVMPELITTEKDENGEDITGILVASGKPQRRLVQYSDVFTLHKDRTCFESICVPSM